jgi:hypothetical protein
MFPLIWCFALTMMFKLVLVELMHEYDYIGACICKLSIKNELGLYSRQPKFW